MTATLGDVDHAAPAPSAQTVLVTYEVGACARHDLGATIAMDPTLLPDPRGYHLSPGVGGQFGPASELRSLHHEHVGLPSP